jgi:hypothetical protein
MRSALTRLEKSPKWLADEAGVSYETVRKWLADEIAPKRARVASVAQLLELSEEALMFGTERVSAPAAGAQRKVAPSPKGSWPFSVSREAFDRLSPADKATMDTVLVKFVAGCLAEQRISARKAR